MDTLSNFNPDSTIEAVCANDIQKGNVDPSHLRKKDMPFIIEHDIVANATTPVDVVNPLPFAVEIIDAKVQCRAANVAGTAKVTNGTNDITDAMIMAVDMVMVAAGTINNAYSTIAAGGKIRVVTNGAADRGLLTLTVVKR